jgi:hypothetical protein
MPSIIVAWILIFFAFLDLVKLIASGMSAVFAGSSSGNLSSSS